MIEKQSERDYKTFILEASEILKRKADEIAKDLHSEYVSDVYISLRLDPEELPSLDIQKTYIPIPKSNTY